MKVTFHKTADGATVLWMRGGRPSRTHHPKTAYNRKREKNWKRWE